jgi:hypothetical protein
MPLASKGRRDGWAHLVGRIAAGCSSAGSASRMNLAKGFAGVRCYFPDVHKLKAVDSARRREPGYTMSSLRNKVEPPHAIAKPAVKFVPEADHHIHRIDGVGTRIGPICPIVLAVGSSERMNFKALRNSRLVAC